MQKLAEIDLSAEVALKVEVIKVCDGLGFGEGSISRAAIENQPGSEDLSHLTDEAINSPGILVPVSQDSEGKMIRDDGCGDGRNITMLVGGVYSKGHDFIAKSLHRPKVFGGGATMAAAMQIGLGRAGRQPLQNVFNEAIKQLNENGLDFGAHTDNHASGENCGCGAIDKAPQIVPATIKYREQIFETIRTLGFDTTGLDEIFEAYSKYAEQIQGQAYSGSKVMKEIFDNHKIIKRLADEHREIRIVLNEVESYTVDQEYVRNRTNGRAHVFAIDVWRLKQLADGLWHGHADRQHALLAECIYTLATTGVLTAGDQPVYLIRQTA